MLPTGHGSARARGNVGRPVNLQAHSWPETFDAGKPSTRISCRHKELSARLLVGASPTYGLS